MAVFWRVGKYLQSKGNLALTSGLKLKNASSHILNHSYSSGSSSYNYKLLCERLKTRGLLQVKGSDASKFLQGLITNDMRHLEDAAAGVKSRCMFAMILNAQGRVLYDVIVYNMRNENEKTSNNFIIECDKRAVEELTRLFTMYRIRKKVELADVSDSYKVWTIFTPPTTVSGHDIPCPVYNIQPPSILEPSKVTLLTHDPRIAALGWRVILPADVTPSDALKVEMVCEKYHFAYRQLRYLLGVGEGVEDMPPGKCFPLESNGDYLHGISFHKGCYIGQEFTARTHHTGVVRKRLMPLLFELDEILVEIDTTLEDDKGRNVGRVRNHSGRFGLGLMRIEESLAASQITIGTQDWRVITFRPDWWPVKQSKESLAARE